MTFNSKNVHGSESLESWIDYWENDHIFLPIMRKTAEFFIDKTKDLLNYNQDDILLDFGCGPGDLELLLKGLVSEVNGVDTSTRMITGCRKRFAGQEGVEFYELDKQKYTDLSILGEKRFSIIICLSVIQYFESLGDVKKLIKSVEHVAQSGALFLIADIPIGTSIVFDIYELLRSSLKEGFFFEAVRLLILSRFSKYYKIRSSNCLLELTLSDIEFLIRTMSLNAEIFRTQLTFNRRRVHLLIKIN